MQIRSANRRILLSLAVLALPQLAVAQEQGRPPGKTVDAQELANRKPDATIDFEATQFSLILGGAAGEGILHFQGKDIPFKMKGAQVGAVGYTDVKGSGEVHFLKRLEDFEGNYSYLGAGATMAKGVNASTFQNNAGVVVRVTSKSAGASVNLGIGGVSISLKD
jgi:hypothetical protein